MKEKLKIKVSIADRIYPMTVFPDQEESLRLAAQNINKNIKYFEENYAVRDKQDVLAMCALQFSSKIEQIQIDKKNKHSEAEQRLLQLTEKLENIVS